MVDKNTKNSKRKIIGTICFLGIFAFLFTIIANIFRNKEAQDQVVGIYDEPKDSLDVIFLGCSRTRAAQPMILWDDYGITSYNYNQDGQPLTLSYYSMLESYELQHPNLFVVDLSFLHLTERYNTYGQMHTTIDNYRNPIIRYNAIKYTIPEEDQAEFFFPFLVYHDRYKVLERSDFVEAGNWWEKGAGRVFRPLEEPLEGKFLLNTTKKREPSDVVIESLNRMVDFCEEKDVELLFIVVPFFAGEGTQSYYNWAEQYAAEKSVDYINYLYRIDEIGLVWEEDLYNEGHLNIFGEEKFSHVLGRDLMQNYDLEDQRNNDDYREWHDSFEIYKQTGAQRLLEMQEQTE